MYFPKERPSFILLFLASPADSVGSGRVPGGDERDAGRAGRPRGGAAKERPAAGERPDGAVAAHIHVRHLLLQPDVRHVRGEL